MVTKRRWGRDIDGSKIGERHKREGTGTRKAAWWERRPIRVGLHYLLLNVPVRSGQLQHPLQGICKAKSAGSHSGHSFVRSSTRGSRFGRPSRPGAARVTASSAPLAGGVRACDVLRS